MPSAAFQATISVGASTFSTELVVTYGGSGCLDFLDGSSASVGGVPMKHHALATTKSCGCYGSPGFEVAGAALPGSGDGTYTLMDGASASMTVASLFAQRSVSLRGTNVLQVGTRVYFDFLPTTDQVGGLYVSYWHNGGPVDGAGHPIPDWNFTSDYGRGVFQDANGWYFTVPAVPSSTGTLQVDDLYARPHVLSCTGVTSCEAFTSHTEQIATSIVP